MMALSGHASPATVLAVILAHTTLGALVVAARLYARFGIAKNAGLDDLLICVSLLFAVATTVSQCVQVEYGVGRHVDDITQQEAESQLKALYISIWTYNLSLSCTKVSILLQYLRIFPQRRFRTACYLVLTFVVLYSCYVFFTAVFTCIPVAKFWDTSITSGKCLNRTVIWLVNAGLNILTDITLAVLPLPILKQLKLPKRQRTALMIVFGLGGATCVVSIFRLQSLYAVSIATDVSWENPLAAIWSNVEINIAILCSCLPTLRCLFPKILRSQLSGNRSRDDSQNETDTGSRGRLNCGPKIFPKLKSRRASSVSGLEKLAPVHARQQSKCMAGSHESGDNIEFKEWTGDSSAESRSSCPMGRIHVTTAIDQEVVLVEDAKNPNVNAKTMERDTSPDLDDVDVQSTSNLVQY